MNNLITNFFNSWRKYVDDELAFYDKNTIGFSYTDKDRKMFRKMNIGRLISVYRHYKNIGSWKNIDKDIADYNKNNDERRYYLTETLLITREMNM